MNTIPIGVMWLVTAFMVEGAIIDGWKQRVPNWLTYNLAFAGLAYCTWSGGWTGLLFSLQGIAVAMSVLLVLYCVGMMGAGDVKLMGAVGAWIGPELAFGALLCGILVGGVIGSLQILVSKDWRKNLSSLFKISRETFTYLTNPAKLRELAEERKPKIKLLPYGVPLTIGSIAYFAWEGLLF
ncbi:A24 family peptidase [soil metagenome]